MLSELKSLPLGAAGATDRTGDQPNRLGRPGETEPDRAADQAAYNGLTGGPQGSPSAGVANLSFLPPSSQPGISRHRCFAYPYHDSLRNLLKRFGCGVALPEIRQHDDASLYFILG